MSKSCKRVSPAKHLSRRRWCVGRWPGGRLRKRRARRQSLHLPAPLVKLKRIPPSVSRGIARRRVGPRTGGAPGYLKEELAISRCFFGYPGVGKSGGKSANSVMQLGKSSDMEEQALGTPLG